MKRWPLNELSMACGAGTPDGLPVRTHGICFGCPCPCHGPAREEPKMKTVDKILDSGWFFLALVTAALTLFIVLAIWGISNLYPDRNGPCEAWATYPIKDVPIRCLPEGVK